MNRAEAEGTTSLGPVVSEWSVSLYFSDPSELVALAMPSPTFYGDSCGTNFPAGASHVYDFDLVGVELRGIVEVAVVG